MYSILKSNKYCLEIPEETTDCNEFNRSRQPIVSSCFLDDFHILFLFKNGRYLLVRYLNGESLNSQGKLVLKLPQLGQDQKPLKDGSIEFDGNILKQVAVQQQNKESQQEFLESSSFQKKVIFVECKRVRPGQCVIITKNSEQVFLLSILHRPKIPVGQQLQPQIQKLSDTMIKALLQGNQHEYLTVMTEILSFNNGKQIEDKQSVLPHAYQNNAYQQQLQSKPAPSTSLQSKGDFIIKSSILEDKVVYFTIYNRKEHFHQNLKSHHQENQYLVRNFERHFPINESLGLYTIEVCDPLRNIVVEYKQQQIDNIERQIKLYDFSMNFAQSSMTESSVLPFQKPAKTIFLPHEFNAHVSIQQITRWKQDNLLLIVSCNRDSPQNQNSIMLHSCKLIIKESQIGGQIKQGEAGQSAQNFTQWIERLYNFELAQNNNLIRLIHMNEQTELMYALCFAHQRIDGQLFQNKLDLFDIKSGKLIERGYCNLKNYCISPNGRCILDVPHSYVQNEEIFYHIRLLFDKKSLYLFMIDKSQEILPEYHNVGFAQEVLKML